MFIEGQWCEAEYAEIISRSSPGHGIVVSTIPAATEADAEKAIQAARRVFDEGAWANLPSTERSSILLRASELIRRDAEHLAYLECLETGKPISQARAEIAGTAETWRYAAGALRNLSGETFNNQGAQMLALVVRQPVGVVGLILPWNFPFLLLGERLPFILAAGCTVVCKPAETTSATTLEMARLLKEAGLPDGVFNVLTGLGSVVGQSLLQSPLIDKISFTGSTAVGQRAVSAAAGNIKGLGLELGGKNPHIVFADADIEQAVDGVAFGMAFNAGQCCVGGSRLILHSSIRERFVGLLVEKLSNIRVGDPLDEATQVGALFDGEHLQKVLGYIEQGVVDGGELLCGGRALEDTAGYFIEPTVISGVKEDAQISREEIFGPVLTIYEFATYEEAIRLANHAQYGLAASIWSSGLDNAVRAARDVVAGRVWVNTTLENGPEMPLGGMKASGLGRECGMMGIEEYTEVKSINMRLAKKPLWIE
ncbi:unnamed protein product [Cyprideis torosa]|uniref:Uncharacterized protein n=1 Tax=Cyprideis torosa TaxID=163714 RepID=A0A7R8ZQC3_9CRUS|nr:unnamed protein product [Cyprideis torosa]CAG0896005.1 unnamed protein product [Cyprideis torosa]